MFEFLATLIVLGCIVYAVVAITVFVIRIVAVIMAGVAALAVAGSVVWVAFHILRILAENPQYVG